MRSTHPTATARDFLIFKHSRVLNPGIDARTDFQTNYLGAILEASLNFVAQFFKRFLASGTFSSQGNGSAPRAR
jgi:hypothetical protein